MNSILSDLVMSYEKYKQKLDFYLTPLVYGGTVSLWRKKATGSKCESDLVKVGTVA